MDIESPVEGRRQTPLPYGQLWLVLLIQSTEAITATVIYPFIAELIRSTGITGGDEAKVGYYAGIIESVFFISEALICYSWGRASDKYGRRPILLLGPLGLAVAAVGFGLTHSFWVLVVFRAAQGVFNGNIGVTKTVMAEVYGLSAIEGVDVAHSLQMTDATNRADAFMLVPITWVLGVTIAPTMGGLLANPARTWPKVFGKVPIFVDYPYFLPCLVAGLYAFVTFIVPLFGLRETHPAFQKERETLDETRPLLSHQPENSYDGSQAASSPPNSDAPPNPPTVLNPTLKIVLVNYAFLTFTDMAYAVIIPVLYSTSHSLGGLEFSAKLIGTLLGAFSFVNAFIQVGIYKKVLKRIGARRMYQIAYASMFIPFSMFMCEQMLVTKYGRVTSGVWVAIGIQLAAYTTINTAYSAISLLLVDAATPGTLGSVNGLGQTVASGFRGLAPFVASSLFAFSLESQIAGGYFVYIVLLGVTLVGTMCTLKLPCHLS
ncbi:hypothetical protein V5O48_011716 [Marasmius crinis-equi]|uniref:Major facilitator superfamily (MFS) profile domain-containing protein n=1 Tax=Marasmius crinis-equi TaxID=585013 RepID=A0ABR3F574_9AGAR